MSSVNIDKIMAARATRYRAVKPLMSKQWAIWDNYMDRYLLDENDQTLYYSDKKILDELVAKMNKGEFDE